MAKREKLERMFAPVEEHPYKVPENWCWVRLDHVCEIVMGQSPSGTDVTDDESYIPLIGGASDMGELYLNASRYTKVSAKLSKKDDIIYANTMRQAAPKETFAECARIMMKRSEIMI